MSLRRFPLFALSLFLALLLVPSRAYAWDVLPKGVIYSGELDGSRVGYVVSAYNQFDAACYAMGKDPNTIGSAVKQKLSDSDYGGRFYDYAQSFFTQSGGLENVPTWVPAYVILISELGDLVLADYQGVWYSTATISLYDGAMVDFVRVLNGEDLGGGGGTVPLPDDYLALSFNTFNWRFQDGSKSDSLYINARSATFVDGVLSVGSGTRRVSPWGSSNYYFATGRFYVSPDVVEYANAYLSQGYQVVFCGALGGGNGNPFTFFSGRLLYGHNISFSTVSPNVGADYVTQINGSDLHYVTFGSGDVYYDSNGVFCFISGEPSSDTSNPSSVLSPMFTSAIIEPFYVPPSGTWPEPSSPVAPVVPTLPDPVTPTVQPDPVITEPTVTWPSPTITIDPDPVPGTTPTGLDYTELLTRINDNLISIDSFARAINSNLNSLRSDLVSEFNGVVQGLRNIYTYLQHFDDVLERHCVHLQNKLEDVSVDIQNKIREMVRWLADELDFDSESSGNSDLFGILSTISDKLGGGTYEPNPIRDELGYYEWLDNLWDRFLLGDNWQASAGSISQSFGQLTSRFPFSVPWDIVALFRLFVHDPVTPVFDLPLYYSADDYATVHVDLSGWDGVAAVVRPLVFVIFALNLALLSRHLLAGFGADKGGL